MMIKGISSFVQEFNTNRKENELRGSILPFFFSIKSPFFYSPIIRVWMGWTNMFFSWKIYKYFIFLSLIIYQIIRKCGFTIQRLLIFIPFVLLWRIMGSPYIVELIIYIANYFYQSYFICIFNIYDFILKLPNHFYFNWYIVFYFVLFIINDILYFDWIL